MHDKSKHAACQRPSKPSDAQVRYNTGFPFSMRRAVQLAFVFQLASVCLTGQPVGILFDFGARPDSAVVDLMKSEIRQIMAPAQMDLAFYRIGDRAASQAFRKIVIVRFQGSCRSQLDSGGIQLNEPDVLDNPALGRTNISGGRVMPYVQVYCNEVRAFLPAVSTLPLFQLYGRALGRVVAHELCHALLSTRDHARTGVARVTQSARDLTRETLALDVGSISRLRQLYGPQKNEGGSEEPPSSR
jgi:hypothetical protein